jgi:hypothetical protein
MNWKGNAGFRKQHPIASNFWQLDTETERAQFVRIVSVTLKSAPGDERYTIQRFSEAFNDLSGTKARIAGSEEPSIDVLIPLADDQINEVLARLNEYPGTSDQTLLPEGTTLADAERQYGGNYEEFDVGPSLDSEAPITSTPSPG